MFLLIDVSSLLDLIYLNGLGPACIYLFLFNSSSSSSKPMSITHEMPYQSMIHETAEALHLSLSQCWFSIPDEPGVTIQELAINQLPVVHPPILQKFYKKMAQE